MAKKKVNSAEVGGASNGSKGRIDIGIEPAENGFVVRICKEEGGKNPSFQSKKFVASSHGEAMRIAGMGILSSGKKSRGKKSGKSKVYAAKKG